MRSTSPKISVRRLLPILVPAGIVALILTFVLLRPSLFVREPPIWAEGEVVGFPQGRVLSVVIEKDGIYVGDVCVPPAEFADYIAANRRLLAPDYIIVVGTEEARYGDFATAFATLRTTFRGVGATVETRTVATGTRRPRIARYTGWGCFSFVR